MSWLDWFKRKSEGVREDAGGSSMPWDKHPSIYEHVRAHVNPNGPGLINGGDELPDEPRVNRNRNIRFAPGAMDGIMSHHCGGDSSKEANNVAKLVAAYCKAPTATRKLELYRALLGDGVLAAIDDVLEALGKTRLNQRRLYELAQSLALESPDRGPVKFGIALLGCFGGDDHSEILWTLARHDEFAVFCAVAIANQSPDPERALWKLAQNVHGWGRVHIVERLHNATSPEVQAWLLREGFHNSVMDEYLAYTCAVAGGLKDELLRDSVDTELLDGATGIIAALINGGPAESMDEYEDGAVAVTEFLRHVASVDSKIQYFLGVHSVRGFVEDDTADWEARATRGWTPETRNAAVAAATAILKDPKWPEIVERQLESADEQVFYNAHVAAGHLGIDCWHHHWSRLLSSPYEPGRWYWVMQASNDGRIRQIIELAERLLPLEGIATGPADEGGLGSEFKGHQCLDFVLQGLDAFPGQGERLIIAGLNSPVVRNRNMALRAMKSWGRDRWSNRLASEFQSAIAREPCEDVKKRMQNVLDGVADDAD